MNDDLISRSKLFEDLNNNNIPVNVAINEIIRNQPTVNQWIAVNDRMPEEDKEVLICSQWGTIDVGWHYDTYWATEHNTYEDDGDIVAWMPLPEPYKKGENR